MQRAIPSMAPFNNGIMKNSSTGVLNWLQIHAGLGSSNISIALGLLDEFVSDRAGVVTMVGYNSTMFRPGNRVAMVEVGHLRIYPRVEERVCIKSRLIFPLKMQLL